MKVDTNIRILILEDSAADAELMAFELRRANMLFTALRVQCRDTIIRELDEFKPEIILSDYTLPDFNGWEALQIVRQTHPEIAVIMVTGVLPDIEAVDFLREGSKDYVLKDRMARLGSSVKQVILAEQAVRNSEAHYVRSLKAPTMPLSVSIQKTPFTCGNRFTF